jgi:serine/threonine protein kinase
LSLGLSVRNYVDLFELYQFEDETTITPDEFYVCIDKCIRSICEEGQMQFPYIDREGLEEFKVGNIQDLVTREENITFEEFKHALEQECTKFAQILQETHNFLRNLSTLIIENPFPVISFLQKGNLFLGKYEITETPKLIDDISSIYKRKYKHALLEVKPMIGGGNKLKFELIYLAGIQGDESFRQNYFREIVLKNKLRKEEQNEFGELPGGVLYKRISELEATELTLDEYLEAQDAKMKETYSNVKNKRILVCMNEEQAIELGMHLLDQLEILHNMDVLHSNINPTSVYLLEQDITKPAFLDLELAIWDPMQILNSSSRYFQQLPGDKYDTTFRDEKYLPPEHKELAEEYRKTNKIPKQEITNQCDLYSIGAIIYRALTGKPPASFSEDTQDHPNHTSERDLLGEWTCPQELEQLCISNGMASFLIKALAKDLTHRHKSIKEMRDDLVHLSTRLSKIPKPLLKGLEHTSKKSSMLEDNFVLDLHEWNIEDYGLEYLYKFIVESNIPNIRLFGEAILQIRDLRDNRITELNLQNKLLSYEELKLLSFFIKINSSLREIDLSK